MFTFSPGSGRLFILLAMLMLTLAAPGLYADTTYIYIGNDFTIANSPYTTSDFVSGSFTVSMPLAPNIDEEISPTTYSFTDGVQMLNNANSAFGSFFIRTDATGAIDGWFISISVAGAQDEIQTGSALFQNFDDARVSELQFASNIVSGEPGTWIAAPEPTVTVLLTGLLALGCWRSRNLTLRRDTQG